MNHLAEHGLGSIRGAAGKVVQDPVVCLPNGGRVNLGAYGNTLEASRTTVE